MVVRDAATAIDRSGAQECRSDRRPQTRRSGAPAATDRLAPTPSSTVPATRQHPLPDAETFAETFYGEASRRSPKLCTHGTYQGVVLAARDLSVAAASISRL